MSNESWGKSPITGKDQVMVETTPEGKLSRFDISSGYFSNQFPMNYKENPDFDFEAMEASMPEIVRDLKFDDGESYWYPVTIQTEDGIVFPVGTIEEWKWCFAPIEFLSEEELETYNQSGQEFNQKIAMDKAEYFDRFLDAVKNIKGYSLGEFEAGE